MKRSRYLDKINAQYRVHSVVGLLGPRQVGKTTLAKQYAEQYSSVRFFDLENGYDLVQLENPLLTLQQSTEELIIIDEVQLRPDLFPTLRVLVDERPRKFLILGSVQPSFMQATPRYRQTQTTADRLSRDLLRQSSETLAGRIGYIELPPFSLAEAPDLRKLWLRGGFPRSYLAETETDSFAWRQAYVTTFMERDIPALGFDIPPALMRRLWMMLAHYHGNVLNAADISKSLGISGHTVQRYIDILSGTFMIRELQPWFENISKRQVKSSKIYIRDSGLLHTLLGIPTMENLLVYPRLGASWEGFALEEIIKAYNLQTEECFFWSTESGAELDFFCLHQGKRLGFEFKYTDSPRPTKSMYIAQETLKLDHLYVVHPHNRTFPISDTVTALGLETLTRTSLA